MTKKPRARSASTTVLQWDGAPARGAVDRVVDALRSALAELDGYELSPGRRVSHLATYLDTADHRLRRHGLILRHQQSPGPGSLLLTGVGTKAVTGAGDRPPAEALSQELTEAPTWPALSGRLPSGPVLERVAPLSGIRALLPLASARLSRREVAVRDGKGATVARLEWIQAQRTQPTRAAARGRLSVQVEPGQRRAGRAVVAALQGGGFAPSPDDVHDDLLATLDPPPAGRPALRAEQPGDVAVAAALRGFAEAVAENVPGVLDDLDTEFLHDLRVAVRRTRSLLKLAGDVLPARLVDRHGPGFRWLGDITTPTRDLDVYLLELDQLAGLLVAGEASDLDPFADHLRRRRDAEWRLMCRQLRSRRFSRLISGWRAGLDSVIDAGGDDVLDPAAAGRVPTARDLAAARIRRSSRRVTRLAAAITPLSPAEDVHALRKRCKELRYALEAFQPLCRPAVHHAVVKDLRRVQDVLGAFQDGEVQSAGLRELAEQMLAAGRPPAATLLAMGELSARFAEQQHRARAALADQLERYLQWGAKVRTGELLA